MNLDHVKTGSKENIQTIMDLNEQYEHPRKKMTRDLSIKEITVHHVPKDDTDEMTSAKPVTLYLMQTSSSGNETNSVIVAPTRQLKSEHNVIRYETSAENVSPKYLTDKPVSTNYNTNTVIVSPEIKVESNNRRSDTDVEFYTLDVNATDIMCFNINNETEVSNNTSIISKSSSVSDSSNNSKSKKLYCPDKPFSCAVCWRSFHRKGSLLRHVIHHKHYICSAVDTETLLFLRPILPCTLNYIVNKFHKLDESHFTVDLQFKGLAALEPLQEWINHFMEMNNCIYKTRNIQRGRNAMTMHTIYYRCQHFYASNKSKKRRTKGTDCKSTIYAAIKRGPDHGCYGVMHINFLHNHSLISVEALRYRTPTDGVRNAFRAMFDGGLNPVSALQNYKQHLQLQSPDTFASLACDRSICPDLRWVYTQYAKLVKNTCNDRGKYPSKDLLVLESHLATLSDSCVYEVCAAKGSFVVTLVTPLMSRALETSNAAGYMFVDSSDGYEKYRLKVYYLMTETEIGALPLGVIVSNGDGEEQLDTGLRLYMSLVNNTWFGGRGSLGPAVIALEDSDPIKSAFRKCFPKSKILLSMYHLLQGAWRWLYRARTKHERIYLYALTKAMLAAGEKAIVEDRFSAMVEDTTAKQYPLFVRYAARLRKKKVKAAVQDALAQGHNTKMEIGVRLLHEEVTKLIREGDAAALVEFVASEYEVYYRTKVVEVCLGRDHQLPDVSAFAHKYLTIDETLDVATVFHKNKGVMYVVNKDLGMCSCCVGCAGRFCKHQQLLTKSADYYQVYQFPNTVDQKLALYYIACGKTNVEFKITQQVDEQLTQHVYYSVTDEFPTTDVIEKMDYDVMETNVQPMEPDDGPEIAAQCADEFRSLMDMAGENAQFFKESLSAMIQRIRNLRNSGSQSCIRAALDDFANGDKS